VLHIGLIPHPPSGDTSDLDPFKKSLRLVSVMGRSYSFVKGKWSASSC